MRQHLRACLWLLVLTLVLCCGVYPLALWALGQTVFRSQAEGSLLTGSDKQPVGSRLIAQAFSGEEFFQPRPSATSPAAYNAMASGGSNLAANNPKLRGRVAQQLGTMVRHLSPNGPGKGALVGDDIEKWFQTEKDPNKNDKRRDLTAEWASNSSSLVPGWATSSELIDAYVKQWAQDHAGVLKAWKAKNPNASDPPKADDLATYFFDPAIADSFVKLHPGMWPCIVEEEKDGKAVKLVKPDNKGDDIKSIFFDLWLQDHLDVKLEPVPADMVMASGSGLDPHITLKNAQYQLRTRIAAAWADKLAKGRGEAIEEKVREAIEELLHEMQFSPLGGLAGVPLVNVLEVNLALPERLKRVNP